jgi:hypothetical protein
VTLKVKLFPAPKVSGRLLVNPLMPNPAPVNVACDTVTLDPPGLVNVAGSVPVLPTCTLPKLTGLTVIVPGVTPAPESGIVKGEVAPSVVIVKFAVALPCV